MLPGRLIPVALAILTAAALIAAPARAQQVGGASPILTIEPERLLTDSQRGKEMLAGFEKETEALAAENRRIEAELVSEEKALTELRASLAPDVFSKRADAFDTKVQDIRQRQDAKSRDLIARRDAARQNFISDSLPILAEIVGQRRGLVLMDRATVFLSADTVDITDEAIRRIDASAAPQQPQDPANSGENAPSTSPETPKP